MDLFVIFFIALVREKGLRTREIVWETPVHLAVAVDVFDGVFIPRDVFDEIWAMIESVSKGFSSYSWALLMSLYHFSSC